MSANQTLTKQKSPATVQRLFFALWPSTEVRQQFSAIVKIAARCSNGRRTRDENLHITLRFLGTVPEDKRACIERVATEIKTAPFELVLDQLEFKKRQEMVWLTTGRSLSKELGSLVEQLEQGIQTCGFAPEKYTYKPHVTLVKKARKTKKLPDTALVKYHVDTFVLVSSKTHSTGVEYKILKEWKL